MPNTLVNRLLQLERRQKKGLVLALDGAICVWAGYAALYLRLGYWLRPNDDVALACGIAVVLALPMFVRTGLYGAIFRHTGLPAILAIVRACLIYGAIYSLLFTFVGIDTVPRTVGIIQPVLLFLAILASRAAAFYFLGALGSGKREQGEATRVLVYGAGETGRQLAASLRRSPEFELIGFLDDDPSLHSGLLEGVPVFDPGEAASLAQARGAEEVMLAVPTASRRRRQEIVELLRPSGLRIRTLPSLVGIAKGEIHFSDVRPLEIEDLLGRAPVEPHEDLLRRNVTGKVVMVTGGGGSIGSELCRQIAQLSPSRLVIVDASEFNLYAIEHELRAGGHDHVVPLLGSVEDDVRMAAILSEHRPETIYHAAAYKHVPLVECNVLEGLRNNVLGTRCTAMLASRFGVRDFVLISTDKAVRPTNVMGASKRWAELVVKGLSTRTQETRFSVVRFGNVLGSSGSVVPLFRRQIAQGGPVTLTHPEVTRYFMTIPEASQLVLQASAMAEESEVFVLDMGEPIAIQDLAVNMILLSGLTVRSAQDPDGDIAIEYVGLRPGEKLHEELLIGNAPQPTSHSRIIRAHESSLPHDQLEAAAGELMQAIRLSDEAAAMALLARVVEEYRPEEPVDSA